MNWAQLQDGLKAWFAVASGINVADCFWDEEPEGFRPRPFALLRLNSHAGIGGTDEVQYESNGPDTDASVVALGNRTLTWSIRVRTRDATAGALPHAVLERVRSQLYMPSAEDAFAAAGCALVGSLVLMDVTRVYQQRREPEAVLDVRLAAVSDTSELAIEETIGTFEHARVGGTVTTENGATIVSPDQTIPTIP